MICYQQLAGQPLPRSTAGSRHCSTVSRRPTPCSRSRSKTLRGVGLSGAKAASIRDLAEKVDDGLVELDRIARLPDDEVVRELVLVRGIGEWTAHMFLMFQVGRLDVWPIGDFGVRAGYGRSTASRRCRRRRSSRAEASGSARTGRSSLGTAGAPPTPSLPD